MDPIGIRYETLRFSSLAVDSGGEIVAASAKGALAFWDRGGCGKWTGGVDVAILCKNMVMIHDIV